jgi:Methylase involved in ubiquinone/menaquinone biosynthesis
MIENETIDNGKGFDWGLASADYGRYRDIYPEAFYQKILSLGLCAKGQRVLDLATGTGVLPRNLYRFGAKFTGADIAANQIAEARRLSAGMDIDYVVSAAEALAFPDDSFDAVTACQCFEYFDLPVLVPKLARMLKPGGRFAILYMAWLPDESDIARQSEELVLKFNPEWTGGGYKRRPIGDPDWAKAFFELENKAAFDLDVPFTRESWNGRMRACRGIGASLPGVEIAQFDREHRALLEKIAPESFNIPHYSTMLILKVKKPYGRDTD